MVLVQCDVTSASRSPQSSADLPVGGASNQGSVKTERQSDPIPPSDQTVVRQNPFLAAFNVKDGTPIWRTTRDDVPAWCTPTVYQNGERAQLIVNGYKHIGGYDLRTGKELWRLQGGGDIPVPTPVVAHDLIFITNAHGRMAPIYAIRTSAAGDISLQGEESANRSVAWSRPRDGGYMQTPLVYGHYLYVCRDNGVLSCYEAQTGRPLYEERLGTGRSGFTASPVGAAGKLYFTSEDGDIYVVQAGPKFKLLSVNPMGEICMATRRSRRERSSSGRRATWSPSRSGPGHRVGGDVINRHTVRLTLALLVLLPTSAARAQSNWPQWRALNGNRVSTATQLPTTWSLTQNIVWKAPLPSWSAGTPIIWGDRVFVTSPTEAGAAPPAAAAPDPPRRRRGGYGGFGRDPGGPKLLLICLSRKDGKQLWARELDEGNQLYNKQNSSSPSPVTDGKRVWVVTGNGAVNAFDMAGNSALAAAPSDRLRPVRPELGLCFFASPLPGQADHRGAPRQQHGRPILHRGVRRAHRKTALAPGAPDRRRGRIARCLHYSGAPRIRGHSADRHRGRGLRDRARPEDRQGDLAGGRAEPEKRGNYRIIASPLVVDGMIYACSRKEPVLALRAGGQGDITATHTVWKWEGLGGPDVPTPVCDGKHFYMVEDSGRVTCLDAKTGKLIWGPERTALGTVSASPLLADGKLYCTNESGVTTVLAAGPEFKVLATNELDDSYTLSSLAVAGSQLFLRTGTHLYCIGKPAR